MQATEKAREFILAELEPLDREAEELKLRLAEIEETKEPLFEALSALEKGGKKKAKNKRKDAKPSVKKEHVQPVCLALARDNPNITKSDLEELVEESLVNDKGFSRNGVKMQIRKCLGSDLFTISEDGKVTAASPETSAFV